MESLHPFDHEWESPTGRIPLFPLPGVVLFPHALLPLHVFEPRYLQMTADVLAGDRCLAIGQLQPGWETLPVEAIPAVSPMLCLGRIVASEALADGRFAIVVQGLTRAAVLGEPQSGTAYRVVEVALRPDGPEPAGDERLAQLRRELIAAIRDGYRDLSFRHLLDELTDSSLPAGVVCDVAASALALSSDRAQAVLAEVDLARRCELVIGQLREQRRLHGGARPSSKMPRFSSN